MPAQSAAMDLAFNCEGWAYDTGKKNRQRHLVIRLLNTGLSETPCGPQCQLSDLSELPVGRKWSVEALTTTNALRTDLAIVVGELLPLHMLDTSRFRTPKGDEVFSTFQHTIVPTFLQTGIVVRLLDGRDDCLNVVVTGFRGLFNVGKIPEGISKDRIVYYDEWAGRFDSFYATSKIQEGVWNRKLDQYLEKYVREHASSLSKAEQNMRLVGNLIKGRKEFTPDDAKEVIKAFEELYRPWFHNPQCLDFPKVEVKEILQLAKGLREDGLCGRELDEEYYHPFISNFCHAMAVRKHLPDNRSECITKAYRFLKSHMHFFAQSGKVIICGTTCGKKK
ncbi:hypothetical protein PT974_02844 [Cladobotryum mycophilum]|uniref:Uncharacterized protein n=1 Tax=Cladobotryum mycophilum TaxID=491253 RepID=A0ABR0SZ82_9HYPO